MTTEQTLAAIGLLLTSFGQLGAVALIYAKLRERVAVLEQKLTDCREDKCQ